MVKITEWVLDIWYRDPMAPKRARKRGQPFEEDSMEWRTIGPQGAHVHEGNDHESWIACLDLALFRGYEGGID